MIRDPHSRVRDAIRALADRGVIDDAQAAQVTDAVTAALAGEGTDAAPPARFSEIAGYVGGAVTAGATMLLIAQSWENLSKTGRVTLLALIALVLIVAAVAIGGGTPAKLRALRGDEGSARRRLVSTLFTLAAAAAAGAAGAATDRHETVAASIAGLFIATVGYALVPALIGQLGTWLAAVALVISAIEVGRVNEGLLWGIALIVLGAVWAALSTRKIFAEPYVALGLGAATALFGAQLVLVEGEYHNVSYALTAAVAVVCFAGFLFVRNWLVLATAVLAVVLVVPEALNDWTDGSLGGATLLLAAGVALLLASGLGLRLRDQR